MRKLTDRTRFFLSSYYIGSGNKVLSFTWRPEIPFEKIKEIYGNELEKLKEKRENKSITQIKLTVEERKKIKQNIKEQVRHDIIKRLLAILTAVCITIGLMIIARYIIHLIMESGGWLFEYQDLRIIE